MIFYFKKFGNNIKIVWWFLFLGFWQHKKRHVLSIEYLMRAVVWSDLKPRNQVSMMMLTFDHQNKLLERQNRMRENSISGVRVTRIRRKYCMFADKKVERKRERESMFCLTITPVIRVYMMYAVDVQVFGLHDMLKMQTFHFHHHLTYSFTLHCDQRRRKS